MNNFNNKVASVSDLNAEALTWTVTNNLNHPIRTQWLDYEGRINEPGTVVPANTSQVMGITGVNNVFLVTKDGESDPIDSFVELVNVQGAETVIGGARPLQVYRWQGANCENVRSSMDIETEIADPESFTIEAWLKPTPGANPYFYSLLGTYNDNHRVDLGIDNAGNITFYYLYGEEYSQRYHAQVGAIIPGMWCHIALTMERDSAANPHLRFQINGGVQQIQHPERVGGFPLPAHLGIKSLGGGSQLPFCGQIAEFRLWKTARSEAEVVSLINNRVPASELNKLQAYFPLNGNLEDSIQRSGITYTAPANNLTLVDASDLPL